MTFQKRAALRRLLISEWLVGNTDGYAPDRDTAQEGRYVRIHLGDQDDEMGFPQVTLTDVSSTARGASGYYGIKSGEGYTQKFDGRIDVVVWTGSEDHLPNGQDPERVAATIGKEVHSIIHANSTGLYDPNTGEMLADNLAAFSEPITGQEPDYSPPRFTARIEAGYVSSREPPSR